MARNEFCDVQSYADDWSREAPEPHWSSGRIYDAISSMIEQMWQRPDATVEPVAFPEARPLRDRFLEQAERWGKETAHLSSPSQKMAHLSHQAIIGMAAENKREVMRLLLYDLRDNRRPWFWALSYLAQDNPITPSDAGKMDKMIAAWLNWGKQEGLL